MINCDLGENEPMEATAELMQRIGAANICCGVHAGNAAKTEATLRLAGESNVQVGAHPGFALAGGRGTSAPTPSELRAMLETQIGAFFEMAETAGVDVAHIKLHGAVYSRIEHDPALAEVYLDFVGSLDPTPGVFVLAGGRLVDAFRGRGIRVWEEVFADRGYTSKGELVPRDQPGALITEAPEAVRRLGMWRQSGLMAAVDGSRVPLPGDTVCVHSDSPGALELLDLLRINFSNS